MRSSKRISTAIVMAGLTVLGFHPAVAGQGGTDVLHYTVSTSITGGGYGSVTAILKEQGNAAQQELSMDVKGLAPTNTYLLQAWLTDLSNATDVAEFTSDLAGAAKLSYKKGIASKSKGKGKGVGASLPSVLDPVTGVLGLDIVSVFTTTDISNIVSTTTQVVASADLTNPTQYQYLVQRNLDNDGVIAGASGSLRLRGQNNTQQFLLRADHLVTNTTYMLSINTAVLQTLTSDRKGRIQSMDLPAGSPNVLDIWSVELLDGTTNVVLSTTLP